MLASSGRRSLFTLVGAAAAFSAGSARAEESCRVGPPPHAQGPDVFLAYDQMELDAAYSQPAYEPNMAQLVKRWASNSALTRQRLGEPRRYAYGPNAVEKLDVYRTKAADAPVFVFIHGGAWNSQTAKDSAFPAETFVGAGVHFVVPDFSWVQDVGGSLMPIAAQIRRAVAWTYQNARLFGGDPSRFYVSGHSSGGHMAGVVLTTDWQKDFSLPADFITGGIILSGMYNLTPVRLSSRSRYVKFDDAVVEELSAQRHIDRLRAPLVVAYGSYETPEFQRQSREFAAAVKKAGKPVELVVAENYSHMEMPESLANPYGICGRAALKMMSLA